MTKARELSELAKAVTISDNRIDFDRELQLSNASITADVNFGDNDKVIFGAGSDLQIYHSGTNSFITEQGTGSLYISATNLNLRSTALETYLTAVDNGAVTLYYDNAAKLATTSTGIDVTGTINADILTVNGTGTSSITSTVTVPLQINGASIPTLRINNTGGSVQTDIRSTTSEGFIRTATNHPLLFGTNQAERIRIDASGNVGIGITSPASLLHVKSSTVDARLQLTNSASADDTTGSGASFQLFNDDLYINAVENSGNTIFRTDGGTGGFVERLRISSAGNVGIGTSSPNRLLTLENGDLQIHDSGTGDPLLNFSVGGTQASPTQSWTFRIDNSDSDKFQLMDVTDSRIVLTADGSGNVGIGTTSPSEQLHVSKQSNVNISVETTGSGGGANAGIRINSVDGGDFLWQTGNATGNAFRLYDYNSAAERLRINANGQLLLGTTTSRGKLTIAVDSSSSDGLYLDNANGGATMDLALLGSGYNAHGANPGEIWFYSPDNINIGGATGNTNSIKFLGGGAERMRITSSGRVGIGIDPQADFHIKDASDVRMLFTSDQTGNTSSDGTFLGLTDGGIFNIRNREATNTIFYTNDTERMRITSAGTITIGTASSLTDVGGITLRKDTQGGYSTLLFLQNQPGTGGTMGADIHMGYAADYGSILRFYGNPFNSRPGGFQFRRVTGSGSSDLSMQIGTDGAVIMPDVYNDTTGSGANVNITSAGQLQRSTSSLRYKNTVNDATHGLTELLTLRSVTYKGNNDGDTVFGGLIAEEVHDAGLTEFVQYDDDGQPDALAYGNMVSLCIKAIQELKTELDEAKARITELETA